MTKEEIISTSKELVSEYGKSGALDVAYEYMRESTRKKEILFWEDVTTYIERNYDDDMTFGYWEV